LYIIAATLGLTAVAAAPAAAAPAPAVRPASATGVATQAAAAMSAIGTADFATQLDALAVEVAATLGADAATMQAKWRAADGEHQIALVAALSQVGTPYRRNTSKPGVGFDCSGLTTYAWAQAGYTLPRQSGSQIKGAAKRTRETAMAGDLVQYPGHVMMYLGVDNFIVHSPFSGRNVEVTSITKKRVNSVRWGDPTG
jgi:cell wall-associated NlpC family hydrolase